MNAKLPDPLTPPDCDLRGLTFMPLDVLRLRDSDLGMFASGDEFKGAVMLWCAAWHQTPAGSLPDDDRALRKFAGLDPKPWAKAKEGALRNWAKCSDGRLYHPVVAEKALEAWTERTKYRAKRDQDRERLKDWRDKKRGGGNVPETPVETPDETRFETPKTGTGSGGKGTDTSEAKASAQPDPDQAAWSEAKALLAERCGASPDAAGKFFGKLLSEYGLEARDLLGAIGEARANRTGDPKGWLAGAAASRAKRRQSDGLTPSERAMRSNIQ